MNKEKVSSILDLIAYIVLLCEGFVISLLKYHVTLSVLFITTKLVYNLDKIFNLIDYYLDKIK